MALPISSRISLRLVLNGNLTILSQFTVEGFLKLYDKYPVSLNDSVPFQAKVPTMELLAMNLSLSTGKNRAFGVEFLYRSKKLLGFNTLFSFTLVRSETSALNSDFNSIGQMDTNILGQSLFDYNNCYPILW